MEFLLRMDADSLKIVVAGIVAGLALAVTVVIVASRFNRDA